VRSQLLELLVFFTFLISCEKNQFDSKLKENELPFQFDGKYQLLEYSEVPKIILGEEPQTQNIIKIRIVPYLSSNEIPNLIKNQLAKTFSNYQYSSVPYPGQISQLINCGTKRRPILKQMNHITYMQLYARNRFGLAICDNEPATHLSYTSYFMDVKFNRVVVVELRESTAHHSEYFFNLFISKFNKLKPISLIPYQILFQFN
jgi:hypothetical protein